MPNAQSSTNTETPAVVPFDFESYGVFIRIESNLQAMVDEGEKVVRASMLNDIRPVKRNNFDVVFQLNRTKRKRVMIQDDEILCNGGIHRKFFKFFDSIVRVAIAERAVGRAFFHAGVVGWKGRAILMPADSFRGKSTLVTELVRAGATYYSDEFAIIDSNGLVYPFARRIGRRTEDYKVYDLSAADDLGGTIGVTPIPVGFILITEYKKNATWSPKILSPGQGVLEMIPFTLCLRHQPDFSLEVLNNIASNAIIAFGLRGTAEKFAKTLLNFVDKHID